MKLLKEYEKMGSHLDLLKSKVADLLHANKAELNQGRGLSNPRSLEETQGKLKDLKGRFEAMYEQHKSFKRLVTDLVFDDE